MKFGVIIVNYNSAPWAVDAALSALGDDPAATAILVDNASTDDSRLFFADICNGAARPEAIAPPGAPEAPAFYDAQNLRASIVEPGEALNPEHRLTFVFASKNNGFAAGNNIGLSMLRMRNDIDAFLLLNPDAILAQGTFAAFRARLADRRVGMCGASVLRFENPNCVQAFGGAKLRRWILLGDNIGAGASLAAAPDQHVVERAIDYPLGCAIAFRKDFLHRVGDLDERYFLYYEEADWARRAAPFYSIGWAPKAVVYHRHGGAAGSNMDHGGRSPLSDYHMARSRMLFALKWRRALAPILAASSIFQSLRRLSRGHRAQAIGVIRGTFSPFGRKSPTRDHPNPN